MVLLGLVLLGVALLASVASVGALLWGRYGGGGKPVTKMGYLATYVAAGSLTLAILDGMLPAIRASRGMGVGFLVTERMLSMYKKKG